MGAATGNRHYERMVFALTDTDDDLGWLARACASQHLRLSCYDSLAALTSALAGGHSEQVILLAEALPRGQSLEAVLGHLRKHGKQALRVLVFARADDLQMRLDAHRGDCVGFHLLPMTDTALTEALAPLSPTTEAAQAQRVLVVDDVPLDASITAQLLRRAGFEVQELTDELAIMDSIRDFRPDLILMDLNMPKASGAELTAIIRDHSDLLLTPIVFLSGEQDAQAQREALRLGADEFLSKPADPEALVDTVRDRLERSRGILRRFLPAEETDSASGLMSRQGFLRLLERHLAAHAPASGDGLLFISIDNAAAMLRSGGVGADDMLLAHIGNVLRGLIGRGASAARFGQHSFMVLTLRSAAAELPQLAQQIGHQLGDRVIQLGSSQQRIALSIGIARLADRADAITHVSRAQVACGRAHEQSPGRIAQYSTDDAASAVADAKSADGGMSEAIIDALVTNALEPRFRPLLAVSERAGPSRRFALEAWLPADAAPDGRARWLDPCGDTQLGELRALMDYWLLEQAFAVIADDRSDPRAKRRAQRLNLFVPQSMATLRGRRWVLWIRDRLLELGPDAAAAVIVTLQTEDVLAHLGIANSMFPLLARLKLRICLKAMNTQPAALSLLTDYPNIGFVEPAPAVLLAPPEQGELEKLINAAHTRKVRVAMASISDAEALSRAWQSGIDLAAGDFVQPAMKSMVFDFHAAKPDV